MTLAVPGDPRGLVGWRIDHQRHAPGWASGEGAFRFGGRWNSKGVRAVYCALDAATAILEVAVHKGFRVLDTVPHVLTALVVADRSRVHVVDPATVSNPNWLQPGIPSAGQQRFGDDLLARYGFVVVPSVVSSHSLNMVFDPSVAGDAYRLEWQEPFALDPRLHPPS